MNLCFNQITSGLLPSARIKIQPTATAELLKPSPLVPLADYDALAGVFVPQHPNRLLVATNKGTIVHGVRFGEHVSPRVFYHRRAAVSPVTALHASPFFTDYFAAVC